MTDQTIPADEVRTIIAFYRDDASNRGDEILESLQSLLPPLPRPPLPTLADMTDEERRECKWMQCDVEGRGMRYVIANPSDRNGLTELVSADGGIGWTYPERVTPRPDLPRLEWPSDQKPDPGPALPDGWRVADHKDYGRVIVANQTPNSDGNVYFLLPADDPMGYDWFFCDPAELTYLDTDQ